jgi:hypothetical protein
MDSHSSAVGPHWRRFNNFLRREKAIQAMRRAVYRSIDRGNEGPELLSGRFPTPIETREEGVRRALLGWPADSRLARRRRVELFAKAAALRLSPLALLEALEHELAPLMGVDFGQASRPRRPWRAVLAAQD